MGMLGRMGIKAVLDCLNYTQCKRCYWMLNETHLLQKALSVTYECREKQSDALY